MTIPARDQYIRTARAAALIAGAIAALCIVALCACDAEDDAREKVALEVAPDGVVLISQSELDALRANQAGGDTVLLTGRAAIPIGPADESAVRDAGERARASCGEQAARYAKLIGLRDGTVVEATLRVVPQ